MQSNCLNVVGVMSGTSLDACDFVLTKVHLAKNKIKGVEFLDHAQKRLPQNLKKQTWTLLEDPSQTLALKSVAELNQAWGKYYGSQLATLKKNHQWEFSLVGLHGQTVYHQGGRLTWQMGSLSAVAALVKLPVVGDFRSLDVELGYQGAPLAPLFHEILAPHKKNLHSIHNLGGISNLTLIQKREMLLAFDSGPANMPMDTYLSSSTKGKILYDKAGGLAAIGKVNPALFKALIGHPYFKKQPPKSSGREQFGGKWLMSQLERYPNISREDILSTLTEWVAWSIANAYIKFAPRVNQLDTIYFCGGGALNIELLNRIQRFLPSVKVSTTERLGWPVFAIEGGCFAFLAAARVLNHKWDLRRITGNPQAIRLGVIYEG